jgi:hypothetical protein
MKVRAAEHIQGTSIKKDQIIEVDWKTDGSLLWETTINGEKITIYPSEVRIIKK